MQGAGGLSGGGSSCRGRGRRNPHAEEVGEMSSCGTAGPRIGGAEGAKMRPHAFELLRVASAQPRETEGLVLKGCGRGS
eukprot:scaffold21750_cov128-Isochrysis_galbana.AAC.14